MEIAKELGRDHRTVEKLVISPAQCNGRSDKGKIRKQVPVSHRTMRQIKKEVRRNPLKTSKEVLESVGVPDVPKSTRCRVLRIRKCGKSEVRPPLKDIQKKKRIDWAKNKVRVNFQGVFFTDECRATPDGPDVWRRGWYCKEKRMVLQAGSTS